jgi:CubicO group peptidase (beta-lactamase class C family)
VATGQRQARPAAAHEYFATLAADGPHAGPFCYRSIVIDVLAWVLEKAGQARFADLVAGQLWQPMGAEHDADITVDAHGNALADGGISATLRDAGRIGRAGDGAKGYPPGAHYRNCWWVTDPSLPAFNAAGINGQHIFVHGPARRWW